MGEAVIAAGSLEVEGAAAGSVGEAVAAAGSLEGAAARSVGEEGVTRPCGEGG